ncbi:MAG: hypothetical protein Q8P46_08330 [Hyphomicrobiales bacterium]|nr:hypothetical protein [Hyphomicrobiales bacterium]
MKIGSTTGYLPEMMEINQKDAVAWARAEDLHGRLIECAVEGFAESGGARPGVWQNHRSGRAHSHG